MNLSIDNNSQTNLKKLLIARKLALNYDYCLDEKEAKKEINHIYEHYLNKKKVSKQEIYAACSEHSGRRYDEIENELAQSLSSILDI